MSSGFKTRRRTFLGGLGASMALSALPLPAFAQGAGSRTLRFIPQADVTVVDPLSTTAYSTRNHAHLCWDTLYGIDDGFVPQPQLAEGHRIEDDGKRWIITLRDGPTFHDGEKVLSRDAVASIRRWMLKDTHGQTLANYLDEIRVIDDRNFELRLKRPFGSLLTGLAKASAYPCFIFPERFAEIDPAKGFTEVVGSGPYRFMADERMVGSKVVYQRYDNYVPTPVGTPSMIAGPKLAHFERVEWNIIPDTATASAAMLAGEQDWFEIVPSDLEELLATSPDLAVDLIDEGGYYAGIRLNHKQAPFDDPAVRRALFPAIQQSDFMQAVAGSNNANWRDGVGYFPVSSPYASDAGMEKLTSPRDLEAAKAALAAAGAAGAKVTLLHPTDVPPQHAVMSVLVDVLGKIGLTVNDVNLDFGSLVQRRANPGDPEQGGWNVIATLFGGADFATPASNLMLRGNGDNAWFGWPTSPKLEELRNAWFEAEDMDKQKEYARQMQLQAFEEVPYIPIGQFFQRSAYRKELQGVRRGMVSPLNVQRG